MESKLEASHSRPPRGSRIACIQPSESFSIATRSMLITLIGPVCRVYTSLVRTSVRWLWSGWLPGSVDIQSVRLYPFTLQFWPLWTYRLHSRQYMGFVSSFMTLADDFCSNSLALHTCFCYCDRPACRHFDMAEDIRHTTNSKLAAHEDALNCCATA